jgi:hypothetical protein
VVDPSGWSLNREPILQFERPQANTKLTFAKTGRFSPNDLRKSTDTWLTKPRSLPIEAVRQYEWK